MPGRGFPRPTLSLAVVLLAGGIAGCSSDLSGQPPARPSTPASVVRPVRVVHPQPVESPTTYDTTLYVERDVRVTARRSGVIEEVLADRGAMVRAGQPLAVLERDVASAELEMARQTLLLAESELQRVQPLYEQKIASQSDFDRTRIARDRARSEQALAEAALERCTVRAPFAGVVAERWAVLGLRVEEDDGTPLFRVVARDPLRARVDVPEGVLRSLKEGDAAEIFITGEAGPALPARVAFIGPAIDAASGTVPVIVEIPAKSGPLKPGAAVRVRFESSGHHREPVMSLPREALLPGATPEPGDAEVMVVERGQAVRRRLKWLESRGSLVLVRGPVDPSDRIIVGAGTGLAEGDKVEPREEGR